MADFADRLKAALADRYRIERELGAGGMATVHLAEDLKHHRQVAVKVLRPELAASLGAERFLREITIAARLNHPHILPLHDSGAAGEFLFYIMPFVEGPSLREKLAREGELPVDDAVRILRDVADAMAHAHGQGVVHRDLKPENVMLTGGHAVVTDFGIAKALHEAGQGATLTATGMAIGTPAYMAPEQAAGDAQVDHRADLYALGILGYELLTGAPPFAGASPQQTLLAHLARTPEPIHTVRPSTPVRVAAAVMRCLEKRPADRWQSATEFRQQLALEEASSGESWRPAPATVAGSMPITEDLCRRMDRASFDPRMVGDGLSYLDNQVRSDVLVILIPDWGVEATDPAGILPGSPYRIVVPTLYGFEAGRKTRIPIGVGDHLVLLEALLGHLGADVRPGVAIAAGFSAAGDVVLRLAAGCAASTRLDGCLTLGCNLGVETCFVTGVLAEVTSSAPEALLPALTRALGGATTVDDWLNLAEYFHQILGNLRDDFRPVQRFAQGIVAPWKAEGVDALIGWYRAATAAGRRVRCVFEDNDMYRAQVRALQLRNLDEGVLGEHYQPGSIIVEPVAGHFDLLEPGLVRRHVDALVTDVRAARAS